jgi:hypothetical protein
VTIVVHSPARFPFELGVQHIGSNGSAHDLIRARTLPSEVTGFSESVADSSGATSPEVLVLANQKIEQGPRAKCRGIGFNMVRQFDQGYRAPTRNGGNGDSCPQTIGQGCRLVSGE